MTSVAIVIPAYNEGPSFGASLVRFADYFAPYRPSYEVTYIIVDDASTDETLLLSKAFARYRSNVVIVAHDRRYGIGHALRTAFRRVCAQYTVVLDGSLTYAAAAAMELLEALERSGADVAVASPYMRGAHRPKTSFIGDLRARFGNRVLSAFASGRCASFTCILRAYRTQFLKQLSFCCEGVDAIPELLFAAIHAGGRIVELPMRRHWSILNLGAALIPHPPIAVP